MTLAYSIPHQKRNGRVLCRVLYQLRFSGQPWRNYDRIECNKKSFYFLMSLCYFCVLTTRRQHKVRYIKACLIYSTCTADHINAWWSIPSEMERNNKTQVEVLFRRSYIMMLSKVHTYEGGSSLRDKKNVKIPEICKREYPFIDSTSWPLWLDTLNESGLKCKRDQKWKETKIGKRKEDVERLHLMSHFLDWKHIRLSSSGEE